MRASASAGRRRRQGREHQQEGPHPALQALQALLQERLEGHQQRQEKGRYCVANCPAPSSAHVRGQRLGLAS